MKIVIFILALTAITIVNSRRFDGPLNLKNIGSNTFNVEDSSKLIVGTSTGDLYISKFERNAKIVNYKADKKHYGAILGIKLVEGSGQYITVGKNGRVLKWSENFNKVTAQAKYNLQSNNIKSVAFVTNRQNRRQNRRLAFSTNSQVFILDTIFLKELKNFTAESLNITTIKSVTFLNGILVVYGHEGNPVSIDLNFNNKTLFSDKQGSLQLISQYNSPRDSKAADGYAITGSNNLYYINLEGKDGQQQSRHILKVSQTDSPSSLNYCGRTIYNQSRIKQIGRNFEHIILVGFKTYFQFYYQVYSPINKNFSFVKGQKYTVSEEIASGILELQCFTDYAYLLTKNGNNDQLITISMQYQYEDPTKDSGFGTFFIMALIVVLVFYQINRYISKKKEAKSSKNDSRYVQLEERINVYNNPQV